MSTQVRPVNTALAEASDAFVKTPELPLQLEQYIHQSVRDESTVWGMAMVGFKDGRGDSENLKEKVMAGKKRGLQCIESFGVKFNSASK